jgi:protein transport protein HofC
MTGFVATIAALILIGVVVLVALRIVYALRPPSPADGVYQLLNVGAWTCFIIGLLGLTLILTGPIAILLIFVAPAVALIVYAQHLATQRRILLSVLTIAAEKDLPLVPALEAFAGEFRGRGRTWAMRLARLLEGGLTLPEAIQRNRGALPQFSAVYAQAGHEMGATGAALREAAETQSWGHSLWNSLAGWVFYVLIVLMFGLAIATFSLISLVPAFESIFMDFGIQLPALTRGIIAAGRAMTVLWPLVFLVILGLGVIAIACLACESGWIRWLPGLDWLLKRSHAAVVLRNLALATERDFPIPPLLQSMATVYPSDSIRRHLSSIAGEADRGHDWRDALQKHGLVGRTDAALLESAQRAGNLPWALRTVADRGLTRLAYRIQGVIQFFFPWIIFGVGILVFLFVLGMFLPLIDLIGGMA